MHTETPPTRPPGTVTRLGRRWLRGWLPTAHLVLDVVVGGIWLAVPIMLVTGVVSIPAVGLGILVVLLAIWTAAAFAWVERHRVRAFLGVDLHQTPPDPAMPTWRRLFLDPRRWREVAGITLEGLWGVLAGTAVLAVLSWGLALLLLPLFRAAIAQTGFQPWSPFWPAPTAAVTEPWLLALYWCVGLLVVLAVPLVAPFLAGVDVHIARWLLAEDPRRGVERLEARNAELTRQRLGAVTSVEAERRRIERDLHDGPQQRLVAVAMDIGMARAALDTDPATARDLLDQAHGSAKVAITEMRQVARGIVPPVLADRGLDAALSALAVRCPVPVEVHVDPRIGRLDPTIEAIAYFCASEALTNVAKHAGAHRARVVLVPAASGEPTVVLTVEDDGHGGAHVAHGDARGGGTGLAGLHQRVASVDGMAHVHSPQGGPTVVTIVLPWRAGGAR